MASSKRISDRVSDVVKSGAGKAKSAMKAAEAKGKAGDPKHMEKNPK